MKLLIPLVTIFLISCGHPDVPTFQSRLSGVVIDKLNWKNIGQDSKLKKSIKVTAMAVGDMLIPSAQTRCTGFLISEDIVMTNNHCISNEKMAIKARVNFAHEEGRDKSDEFTFSCDQFIGSNKELDYALVRCNNNPGKKLGYLKLQKEDVELLEDSLIYLLHHNCNYLRNPGCDWTKKISIGKIQTFDFDTIRHSADSLRGSSGAPLINLKDGLVIGLHHAGKLTNARTQQGIYNEAITAARIVEDIRINYPQVFQKL